MTRRLLASGIVALALLGAGCQDSVKKSKSNSEHTITEQKTVQGDEDFILEKKRGCAKYLPIVEKEISQYNQDKDNTENFAGGWLRSRKTLAKICYSKAHQSCYSLTSEYIVSMVDGEQTDRYRYFTKDLLSGESDEIESDFMKKSEPTEYSSKKNEYETNRRKLIQSIQCIY